MPTHDGGDYSGEVVASMLGFRNEQIGMPRYDYGKDHPNFGNFELYGDDNPAFNQMLLPPPESYVGKFYSGIGTYYSRFDEALRNNYPDDALAMRRDGYIHDLLRHRQLPTAGLPWGIECSNPTDPLQKYVADRMKHIISATPKFRMMLLYLLEDIFYGKYGSQVVWTKKLVNGKLSKCVSHHVPINGDKIVYHFNGTPGVMVYSTFADSNEQVRKYIGWTDRGFALFLYNTYFRHRFVISQFEPADMDFLFEFDKAAAVHGLGLRDRLYWIWYLRQECLAWLMDGLQRVGANGMIIGYYEEGNDSAKKAMMQSLLDLSKNNVALFPRRVNQAGTDLWDRIEPARIGYETLFQLIEYFDSTLRRAFVGQTLSGEAEATGMGSGVAALHKETFAHIIRYDAERLEENITNDLLKPACLMTFGKLPFDLFFKFRLDAEAEVSAKMEWAQALNAMNVTLDAKQLREITGLSAPKSKEDTIPGRLDLEHDAEQAAQIPGAMPRMAAQLKQNGKANVQIPKISKTLNGRQRADGQESVRGLVEQLNKRTMLSE